MAGERVVKLPFDPSVSLTSVANAKVQDNVRVQLSAEKASTNAPTLELFPALANVGGSVVIAGNRKLMLLSGFRCLGTISGSLMVKDNRNLYEIDNGKVCNGAHVIAPMQWRCSRPAKTVARIYPGASKCRWCCFACCLGPMFSHLMLAHVVQLTLCPASLDGAARGRGVRWQSRLMSVQTNVW